MSNNSWPTLSTTGMMYNQSIGVAAPMSASFTTTPSSGITYQEMQFTDTSTGNPSQWHWLFGDGNETNVTGTPKHSYISPGSYPALLEIWNKYGQSGGSASHTIQITPATTSGQVIFTPSIVNMTTGANNWRKIPVTLNRADNGLSSFKIKLDLNSTSCN